jgi:hypothetical protein
VSNHREEYLNIIVDVEEPTNLYGPVLQERSLAEQNYLDTVSIVKDRIGDILGQRLVDRPKNLDDLDEIISKMWHTGWNPETENLVG